MNDWLGYFACVLVFATFYMKDMGKLRLTAIGSNMAFIAYALNYHLTPIFVLHSVLLPLNALRYLEYRRVGRGVWIDEGAKREDEP